MSFVNAAVIGQWYLDNRQRYFEVVAVNNDDIEIQYIDGDVDEIEGEAWLQLMPIAVDEPAGGADLFENGDGDSGENFSDWQDKELQQNGWQGILDKW